MSLTRKLPVKLIHLLHLESVSRVQLQVSSENLEKFFSPYSLRDEVQIPGEIRYLWSTKDRGGGGKYYLTLLTGPKNNHIKQVLGLILTPTMQYYELFI